jgi:hypothetical protein
MSSKNCLNEVDPHQPVIIKMLKSEKNIIELLEKFRAAFT